MSIVFFLTASCRSLSVDAVLLSLATPRGGSVAVLFTLRLLQALQQAGVSFEHRIKYCGRCPFELHLLHVGVSHLALILVSDRTLADFVGEQGWNNVFVHVIDGSDPVPCLLRLSQSVAIRERSWSVAELFADHFETLMCAIFTGSADDRAALDTKVRSRRRSM